MTHGKFATVINCMDGRTQLPVNRWMTKKFKVDYIDTITEPGPNGLLAKGEGPLVGSIKDRVLISVKKHGSKTVVIVGHHDCAGNPGPKDLQVEHVKKALEVVRSWSLGVEIIGVYVNECWEVYPLE
jgi:hypothetical protein